MSDIHKHKKIVSWYNADSSSSCSPVTWKHVKIAQYDNLDDAVHLGIRHWLKEQLLNELFIPKKEDHSEEQKKEEEEEEQTVTKLKLSVVRATLVTNKLTGWSSASEVQSYYAHLPEFEKL